MFPFGQSCEFSFQVSGNQEDQILHKDVVDLDTDIPASITDDATVTNPAMATADFKRKRGVEGPWQGMKYGVDTTGGGDLGGGSGRDLGGGDDETKKKQHRDIERQRRVVMAGHLNTLRSLLPLEFVKGKRSASDHLSETVNYINHLQKSVKELQGKRNKLRTLLESNPNDTRSAPSFNEGPSTSSTRTNVNIFISKIGLEIQISCGKREEGFRLSEALKVLLEEGACVVCSVSGSVNGIFHHNIQCQISDNIDLQRLLQRLYDVV